jgi:ribosomal protein L24
LLILLLVSDPQQQEVLLVKGVAVKIIAGKREGQYGRVLEIDAVANRCDIKLPDGSIKTIVHNFLQTITDKQYTEETKILSEF